MLTNLRHRPHGTFKIYDFFEVEPLRAFRIHDASPVDDMRVGREITFPLSHSPANTPGGQHDHADQ